MMLLLNCWNHDSSIMKRALVRADPPSQALVRYEPSRVIKKSSVTLYCSVEDPGKPENTQYMWLRGNHVVRNATNAKWTIPQVTFEADSNFTCIAYNEGGQSPPGTVNIEVLGEFNHSKLTNITSSVMYLVIQVQLYQVQDTCLSLDLQQEHSSTSSIFS